MESKLLVITAGTVAAGVGKEFVKQRRAHDRSEIKESVRYIDTAYLPTRYSDLRDGEWLQMSIDPRFIDNIKRNEQNYSYLKPLLFGDLMPQIQGSGGGSIRYNAAGAVAIGRDRLKSWIHNGITNLISSSDGRVNLSIALIVSAVGATGSGALERLIEIIVAAAQDANIPSPIHCDVFILQPGPQGVTDLGLANTLALYAEMAATRLSDSLLNNKSYRGRTFMVGWGSKTYMADIEQLKAAAATLVRLSHDPATEIAAEYQEREVDNHVLRELDTQSHLPAHLSTATAVTISLGDLEEKIIQRDAAQLIDLLVFGGKPVLTASGGETIVSIHGKTDRLPNVLSNALNGFLSGQTSEERLNHLLSVLKSSVNLFTPQMNLARLRGSKPGEQASKLKNNWRRDRDTLTRTEQEKIEQKGGELSSTAIITMDQIRKDRMGTGLSLQQLRDDYKELHDMIEDVMRKAQEMNPDADQATSQQIGEDQSIIKKLDALDRAWFFNKASALNQAYAAVQNDINSIAHRETIKVAMEVLEILELHCAEARRNLDIVMQRLIKQRKKNELWAAAEQELRIEMHHPLHLAALPTEVEIKAYAEQVGIFTSRKKKQRTSGVARVMSGENQEMDQLAEFRKWLDEGDHLEALFKGDIDLLLSVAHKFTREQVDEEVRENSVLDVLLKAGEEVLKSRMVDAADKAQPMVSFSSDFAPDLREASHVSAYWRDEEQHRLLQKAINEAFGQRPCTLLKSKDPTEIAVFYYADGLPMSAVNDLTGRCLEAFMKRRRSWTMQNMQAKGTQNGHGDSSTVEQSRLNQRVGVPVYSGRDAEERVEKAKVIELVYRVRGQNVNTYTKEDVPELGLPILASSAQATQPSKDPQGTNGNGSTDGSN